MRLVPTRSMASSLACLGIWGGESYSAAVLHWTLRSRIRIRWHRGPVSLSMLREEGLQSTSALRPEDEIPMTMLYNSLHAIRSDL